MGGVEGLNLHGPCSPPETKLSARAASLLPGATHRSSARRASAPCSVKETSSVIFIFASSRAVRIEADNAVAMLAVLVTRLTRPEGGKDTRCRGEPADLFVRPLRLARRLPRDPGTLQATASSQLSKRHDWYLGFAKQWR